MGNTQVQEIGEVNTLLIIGAGSGISSSVARKFLANGYKVGLISLTQDEADAAKGALNSSETFAFQCDAADPASVTTAIAAARKAMGPISVLHYNPFSMCPDILSADAQTGLINTIGVAVTGLVTATQVLRGDLAATQGAILVTCSGAGSTGIPDEVEAFLVGVNFTGYMVAKAAQHKLTDMLKHKLKDDGIFVGKCNVNATVIGTAFDNPAGSAKIDADTVADAFWTLLTNRTDNIANVDNPPE